MHKDTTVKNTLSHLYLYAKNHYQRTDVVKDLQKIVGRICGCYPESVSTFDIIYWLTDLAWKHDVSLNADRFREFLSDIDPQNCWKVGYSVPSKTYHPELVAEQYNGNLAIIYKCLSILRHVQVKDGDKILIELDEPDPTLLPLAKGILDKKKGFRIWPWKKRS